MGPTPVYGARAEKPLQNADFAMKQTNICRLSGDINTVLRRRAVVCVHRTHIRSANYSHWRFGPQLDLTVSQSL